MVNVKKEMRSEDGDCSVSSWRNKINCPIKLQAEFQQAPAVTVTVTVTFGLLRVNILLTVVILRVTVAETTPFAIEKI
jgi:hypothetical protein